MLTRERDTLEDTARARLAYLTIGQQPLGAPRRALPEDGKPGEDEARPGRGAPTGPQAGQERARETEEQPARSTWESWTRRIGRPQLWAILLLVVVVAVLLGRGWWQSRPVTVPDAAPTAVALPSATVAAPAPSPTPATLLRVHVVGEVMRPGVVSVVDGAIVADAIDAAGGFVEGSDPGELNLATPVSPGMQIQVRGADSTVVQASGGGSDASGASVSATINLNQASAAQLEELPGVGPVTARAIVQWREQHGRFTAVEELQEVSGIGPKSFAELAPLVTV